MESFLEENPPIEANFARAKVGLADAKRLLTSVCGEEGRKAGLALDSHLLLAKLYYTCGDFDNSLDHFKLSEIDGLKTEIALSSRTLRILAESYAAKGLCLEAKNPKGSSKFKTAELEGEMVSFSAQCDYDDDSFSDVFRFRASSEPPTSACCTSRVKRTPPTWVPSSRPRYNDHQLCSSRPANCRLPSSDIELC